MTSSYIDTTILVAVSEDVQPTKDLSILSISNNFPKCVSYYAYRELLVGRVGALCDLHNHIVASDNILEVAIGFHKKSAFQRTSSLKVAEILNRLAKSFNSGLVSPQLEKRRIGEDVALLANKAWRKAQSFATSNERSEPLACFSLGSLSYDGNGLLNGPNNSFDCSAEEVCSAATYLYADKIQLNKVLESLDPERLPENLKNKAEIRARRKALKKLVDKGPDSITKTACRKIGDAFFAQMCPPGAQILTTNIIDFKPMCDALQKNVATP